MAKTVKVSEEEGKLLFAVAEMLENKKKGLLGLTEQLQKEEKLFWDNIMEKYPELQGCQSIGLNKETNSIVGI